MPYVERVTKAGNTIEIERYFTSRYKKKGISRGDKVKPTKEEQEKVNTRQAERKLRILINANYGYGDYHLVLDYIKFNTPDIEASGIKYDISSYSDVVDAIHVVQTEMGITGTTAKEQQETIEKHLM